jgi:hypothetical protein
VVGIIICSPVHNFHLYGPAPMARPDNALKFAASGQNQNDWPV